jgi:hypothetical protein
VVAVGVNVGVEVGVLVGVLVIVGVGVAKIVASGPALQARLINKTKAPAKKTNLNFLFMGVPS